MVIFTEGWPLFSATTSLARSSDDQVPGRDAGPRRSQTAASRTTRRSPERHRHVVRIVRARARHAGVHRSPDHVPRTAAARQSRQREFLSDRCPRPRSCSTRTIAGPLPPALDHAVLENRWDNLRDMAARPTAWRSSIPATISRSDAADVRGRRLVLPAAVLLVEPQTRRPVPPHRRAGQAAGRGGARARRLPGADRGRSARGRRDADASRPAARRRPATATTVTRALDAIAPAPRQSAGPDPGLRRPWPGARRRRTRRGHAEAAGLVVRRQPASW